MILSNAQHEAAGVKRLAKELRASEVAALKQKQLRALRDLYRSSWGEIQGVLAGDPSLFTAARTAKLESQVKAILEGTTKEALKKAGPMVDFGYEQGIGLSQKAYARIYAEKTTVDMGALIHTQAVEVVASQLAADLLRAETDGKDLVFRYLRRSKLAARLDRAISKDIAAGLIQGEARRAVSDRILVTLQERIAGRNVIRVGKRLFSPESYAELVARTRTREATTQGTINGAVALGFSLVMIDTHDEPCPYCQKYNGRVFSLAGDSEGFPVLEEMPPFHPNCECTLHPTSVEHLEDLNLLEPIRKLSNNPRVPVPDNDAWQAIVEKYRKAA